MDNCEPTPSTSTEMEERKVCVNRETQTKDPVAFDNKLLILQKEVKALKEISARGYSNENLNTVLENYFEGIPLELMFLTKRENEIKNSSQWRYSTLKKQFAQTLYIYSPKAYKFVRKHFVIPNVRTIRKWLCSVKCQLGILQKVLNFLKNEVKVKPYLENCGLIIDSMSIRKQVVWYNTEGCFTGNVGYGGIVDVDYEMVAYEALALQIASYINNFKCAVAYFLIKKIDANLQTQLINSCLRSMYESGVTVRSITSDGVQNNIATFKNLGCDFTINKLVTHFTHPCESGINENEILI